MATLKENMEAIKLEKDTKILPENLKSGITAFGVEGVLESESPFNEYGNMFLPLHKEGESYSGYRLFSIPLESLVNKTVTKDSTTVVLAPPIVTINAYSEGSNIVVQWFPEANCEAGTQIRCELYDDEGTILISDILTLDAGSNYAMQSKFKVHVDLSIPLENRVKLLERIASHSVEIL